MGCLWRRRRQRPADRAGDPVGGVGLLPGGVRRRGASGLPDRGEHGPAGTVRRPRRADLAGAQTGARRAELARRRLLGRAPALRRDHGPVQRQLGPGEVSPQCPGVLLEQERARGSRAVELHVRARDAPDPESCALRAARGSQRIDHVSRSDALRPGCRPGGAGEVLPDQTPRLRARGPRRRCPGGGRSNAREARGRAKRVRVERRPALRVRNRGGVPRDGGAERAARRRYGVLGPGGPPLPCACRAHPRHRSGRGLPRRLREQQRSPADRGSSEGARPGRLDRRARRLRHAGTHRRGRRAGGRGLRVDDPHAAHRRASAVWAGPVSRVRGALLVPPLLLRGPGCADGLDDPRRDRGLGRKSRHE